MTEPDTSTHPHGGPGTRPRRRALWLLLVPVALYCLAPLVANRVEPVVLGMPFLLFWMVCATVISPIVIWVVARLDPLFGSGAAEPVPVDDEGGTLGPADDGGGAR